MVFSKLTLNALCNPEVRLFVLKPQNSCAFYFYPMPPEVCIVSRFGSEMMVLELVKKWAVPI